MLNVEDYTVGWICAIDTEYVAAQTFLDKKHNRPRSFPSTLDHNNYTFGRVGQHNVIIAVSLGREYGEASAAGVARVMLYAFPKIQIALMVGIGGGVPSPKHDIRLGDIVVGIPSDGTSGVFEYDFDESIINKSFKRVRYFSPPPRILSVARSLFEAKCIIEGHQFEETINSIIDKNPRLREKYSRPDQKSDKLYRSGFVHPPKGGSSCAAVCGDDPLTIVPRSERTADEDIPAIHYGLIASANQVMKNALHRDKFATEMDVLCFDMEAAGLMDLFPCLLIRGICDYSDSHKNEDWQGYAAMASAAYASSLLSQILPHKLKSVQAIGDIVYGVQHSGGNLHRAQNDQEDKATLDWLAPIDYNHWQQDFVGRRQPGTGKWLLRSVEYQAWLKTSKQTLFCPGAPGAGKTILTSIVVDDLFTRFQGDNNFGIAYLYCNFGRQHEQKAEDLLMSLVKQLARREIPLSRSVKDLYDQHNAMGARPLLGEISISLQAVAAKYSRLFIVVDAIDECNAKDGSRTNFLSEIFNLQAKCGANLFVTSRFLPEITESFKGCTSLEIIVSEEDVQIYLDDHMSRLPLTSRSWPYLQEGIKTKIGKNADGKYVDSEHTTSLLATLRRLETTSAPCHPVDGGFMERIISQSTHKSKLAMQVLSWIVCARRLLTTLELQHALAVIPGKSEVEEEKLPQIQDMISVCSDLVTTDKESNIIRLVNSTSQKYFEQTRKDWFPDAETNITAVCVDYLSLNVFETGFCQSDDEFEDRLRSNPLYDYAAHNWGHHARQESGSCQDVVNFLRSQAKVEAASQAMMVPKHRYYGYSQRFPKHLTGLHLAAYFGVEEAARLLLEDTHRPDPRDSYGRTPLSYAAENGHKTVVELLLKEGVKVDSRDPEHGHTPLSRAAMNGHVDTVRLLLETGKVDTDSEAAGSPNYGETPLSWAARNGHEAVVRLLLETGKVDADWKTGGFNHHTGRTPFSWAAENGHEAVVKLLLETGDVDVDSKARGHPYYGQTPLSWAAINGHEAVVRLLLETGKVDVESKTPGYPNYNRTPLSWAAGNGHEAVVRLLLDTGKVNADSKASDGDHAGRTPLSWAAENGHESIIRLLLETGKVDVDSKTTGRSNAGQTPLSWAAINGHEAVVRLLLETGKVDADSKATGLSNAGRTPLLWAAGNGHELIVKLLLETGKVDADSKASDGDHAGRTPLSWAAGNGHELIVKLLLETGKVDADSKASDGDHAGRTPLSWAAGNGHESIFRLLLETGKVNVDSKATGSKNAGRTPLSWAAETGHESIVRLLLDTGKVNADSKASDGDHAGRTPLSWAAENGHESIVRLLLETGKVDVNSKGTGYYNAGQTPLSLAVEKGHESIVRLLLEAGKVDADSKGIGYYHVGQIPLFLAVEKGHESIVRLLLETGKVDADSKGTGYYHIGQKHLFMAVEKGHESIVRLLLETGKVDADSKGTDYYNAGHTPLSLAVEKGHKGIVAMLSAIDETVIAYSRSIKQEIFVSLGDRDILRAIYKRPRPVVGSSELTMLKLKELLRDYYEPWQAQLSVSAHQQPRYHLLLGGFQKELDIIVNRVMQKWSDAVTRPAIRLKDLLKVKDRPFPEILSSSSTLPSEVSKDIASHPKHYIQRRTRNKNNLNDFSVVYNSLLESKALGKLRYKVRRSVLGHQILDIVHDEVVRNLSLSPKGEGNASFHVQWDLHQFVNEQLDGLKDIGRVFTITGKNVNAFATTCKGYCELMWKGLEYDLCHHIQQYLEDGLSVHEDGTLEITSPSQGQPGVIVTVSNRNKQTIIAIAQQLAWLTAALHYAAPATDKGPSLSNVSFIAVEPGEFIIQPEDPTNAERTEGSCWHEMVGQSLIAEGFPIPPRVDQIGLQLPYEAMLKLGRATTCVTANDRVAIYGISSLLYPTRTYQGATGQPGEDSIQWHFEGNPRSRSDELNEPQIAPSWATLPYYEDVFPSSTHFVGYYEKAGIHLGQKDCVFGKVQRSGLDEASTKLKVKMKSIGAGYSTYSNVAVEIIYPRRTTMSVDVDWYEDVLRTTEDVSALLWDPDIKCGWLVPIQPVLLHMAHIWTIKEKPEEDFSFAPSDETVAGKEFLQNVLSILKADAGKILRKGDGDRKFFFKDLIRRFYTDIRGCELARSTVSSEDRGSMSISDSRSYLRGWELMRFIDKPFLEYVLVEDKIAGCGWEKLVQNIPEHDVVVLVARGLVDVIKPTIPVTVCTNWKLPPKNETYLFASVASLRTLAGRWHGEENPFQTPYTKISATARWKLSNSLAPFKEDCNHNKKGKCERKLEEFEGGKGKVCKGEPKALPDSGVVVFGK